MRDEQEKGEVKSPTLSKTESMGHPIQKSGPPARRSSAGFPALGVSALDHR